MGAKTKTVGGRKSGEGLSEDLIQLLSDTLNGGGIGTNQPAGSMSVGGARGVFGDILSQGGGKVGGALKAMLDKDTERGAGALRSRFGATGGMAFGTPAAYAESLYRAEAAPRSTAAIGGLQLQALGPLLQSYLDIYGRNTPQAQTIQQKSGLAQGLGVVGQLAGPALNFIAPGLGNISPAQSIVNDPSGSFGGVRPPERLPQYYGPGG